MNFNMTSPCDNCPFRNDRPGYLTRERAEEIAHALTDLQQTFTCHKTTVEADEEGDTGDMKDGPKAQHCGGALIFLEHLNRPNQLMRIAERLHRYDRWRLDMSSPVCKTAEEFINLQESVG